MSADGISRFISMFSEVGDERAYPSERSFVCAKQDPNPLSRMPHGSLKTNSLFEHDDYTQTFSSEKRDYMSYKSWHPLA